MIKNLYKIMDTHYVKMKEDVAICAELYNDDHEAANDKAYERLRPGSPYKFKELINEDLFSPKKFID